MSSQKNTFSSRLGFLAAAAGSAIGLCNIWKFPYEVARYGGGSYILLYLFFAVLLAFPAVMADLQLGRSAKGGLYGAFAQGGRWGSRLTLGMVILALFYYAFYNVIVGWVLGYLVALLRGELLGCGDYAAFYAAFQGNVSHNILYTLIVMVGVGLINQADLTTGIERWCKVLLPLLLFFLLLLMGYVLTLPGAIKGLAFLFTPRAEALSLAAVTSAMTQSFLSLGLGCGILITYGAYVDKKEDLRQSSAIIVASDVLVALLAAMLILPLIFSQNISATEGTSLVFISLPYIFAQLGPMVGVAVGSAFFFFLLFAAITSSIALLEVPAGYLQQALGWSRRRSVAITSLVATSLSIPCILGQGGVAPFAHLMTLQGVPYNYFDSTVLVIEALLPIIAWGSIAYVVLESQCREGARKWCFPLTAPYTYGYLLLIALIALANIWMKLF